MEFCCPLLALGLLHARDFPRPTCIAHRSCPKTQHEQVLLPHCTTLDMCRTAPPPPSLPIACARPPRPRPGPSRTTDRSCSSTAKATIGAEVKNTLKQAMRPDVNSGCEEKPVFAGGQVNAAQEALVSGAEWKSAYGSARERPGMDCHVSNVSNRRAVRMHETRSGDVTPAPAAAAQVAHVREGVWRRKAGGPHAPVTNPKNMSTML